MKKEVEFSINSKKVAKKLEEIAKKKYSSTYVSSEYNGRELPYSPPRTWYTPENSMFVPVNKMHFTVKQRKIFLSAIIKLNVNIVKT